MASAISPASQLPQAPFRLSYLAGGPNTTNPVRGKRRVDIAFEVLDPSGEPVRGADVTMVLPSVGATLVPPGGGTVVTAKTDDNGRVRVAGFIPIGTGVVNITIRVHAAGTVQTFTLQHTNVLGPFMTPARWKALLASSVTVAGGITIIVVTRKDDSARISLGPATVTPR
jgi:hypothetical protein